MRSSEMAADMKDEIRSVSSNVSTCADKLTHLEKRTMSANYLAHEVVRMCMSAVGEYDPSLDPAWAMRAVLYVRTNSPELS